MRYLTHDSGEAAVLKNTQVLGDASPLEFDEDGRAGPLEDELAEKVAAMHLHVELGERAGGDPADPSPEGLIEDGVCPWCDEYEGDGVAQHASAAHSDRWAAYTEE